MSTTNTGININEVLGPFNIGAYCIHTSKYGKRGCRVVGHDGHAVIIKRLGGGYYGVPERSLTPCSVTEARNAEVSIKGKSHE